VAQDTIVPRRSNVDIDVVMKYPHINDDAVNWLMEPTVINSQLLAPRSLLGDRQPSDL
jgi:hypothetical protein